MYLFVIIRVINDTFDIRGQILTVQPSGDAQASATYRTGAAARLAGIPVATLRVWERRYEIAGPRTGGNTHRRYSVEDVRRLGLIKALVDLGHPIGSIANLPIATLVELRADGGAVLPRTGNPLPRAATALRPIRVAIVGTALAADAANGARRSLALEVVAACADAAQAGPALQGVAAELLAIELPALRDDAVAQVDALAALVGAHLAIVSYRFGTQATVRALRSRGHVVVRAPLDLSEVESLGAALLPGACTDAPAGPLPTTPAPRFDESVLAELARIATPMYCECPRHVVELLQSIGSFERYSAECENRSPADAELHRYLHRVAGTARAFFEEALVRLARAEGFPLPDRIPAESRHA